MTDTDLPSDSYPNYNPTAPEIIERLAHTVGSTIHTITDHEGNDVVAFVRNSAGNVVREWDLEEYEPTPRRPSGTARLNDVDSFIEYVRQEGGGAGARIYAHERMVTAVFNDHGVEGAAGWADYRAVLRLRASDEWSAWANIDGEIHMSGSEFAEFVEDWRHTIAEPATADLIDMARNFRATRKVEFSDETVDQSGDRALTYTTETQTFGGSGGSLPIPEEFTLVLAPIVGGDAVPVVARFRYRLDNGNARFGIRLVQPEKVRFDAGDDAIEAIGAELDTYVFRGEPVAPRNGTFE